MAVSVKILTAANANRWDRAKVKAVSKSSFASVAKKLVAAKDRYQDIEASTGVPWFVIAVIHQRESSQRWDRSIAQGDPWNKKSTHVPKGRGPFGSFEEAAIDALNNCAPYAARWKDWSAGGTMTLLEHYNGLGYANRGLPSPYIWSGTDQYVKGKYVADGKFSATAVDKQLGCAGLIMAMQDLDASISFDGTEPVAVADLDDVASDSSAVAPAIDAPAYKPSAEDIQTVQNNLINLGYHEVTVADGLWGSKTAAGIAAYKNDHGLPGAAVIDAALIAAINDSVAKGECRLVPSDRATVTAAAIAPAVPAVKQTLLQRFWAKIVGFGAMIAAAFQGLSDQFHATREYVQPYFSWFSDIPGWLWFMGIGGVALLIYVSANKATQNLVHLKQTNRLN